MAVSSSVLPPGFCGNPPSPSATYITIFESFFCSSGLISVWMFMGRGEDTGARGQGNQSVPILTI